MGKIKQSVNVKKKATRKDGKAKYTCSTSKSVTQTVNNTSTTKYAYTKKITKNGKTRYYYS